MDRIGKKVVLAYSGGLDTSVAIRWLMETKGLDVITFTADVGQPTAGLDDAIARAKKIGATKTVVRDLKTEFADDFIVPALHGNALYEGAYPLATSLGRPLIAKHLVEVAQESRADFIAHGCTAKGNDQVRFELTVKALDPSIKVIAPMREWRYTRDEAVQWANERGIPVPVKKGSAFSIDENLWGRSIESGPIEDLANAVPEEAYAWTKSPKDAPDARAKVQIGFEKGAPASLDGKKLDGVTIIQRLNGLAGGNGIGRIDHIENRFVGIKSREIYECPAATVLLKAHKELEDLTLDRETSHFKALVDQKLAELIYYGFWYSPLREAVSAFLAKTQENVTGSVTLDLYKGNMTVAARESPYSLYDTHLATYGAADSFDHAAAKGFIDVVGLPLVVQAAVREKTGKKKP